MGVQTVKALSKTANLATVEAVPADVPVTTATASSATPAAVDFAALAVAAPVVASVGKEGVSDYILHEVIYSMHSYL
jgi:hypothetical protein